MVCRLSRRSTAGMGPSIQALAAVTAAEAPGINMLLLCSVVIRVLCVDKEPQGTIVHA